jgi:hypothetical protein
MDRIRQARGQFVSSSFQHVNRELIVNTDLLSKEALRLQKGMLEIAAVEGHALPAKFFSIYS